MEGVAAEEGIERTEDSKDLQKQSKALDKLTYHVEDRQLDSTRVHQWKMAMASISASAEADRNAVRLREKELAAVKINPSDVDIIANELELDKKVAERTLGEHKRAKRRFLTRLLQTDSTFLYTSMQQEECFSFVITYTYPYDIELHGLLNTVR